MMAYDSEVVVGAPEVTYVKLPTQDQAHRVRHLEQSHSLLGIQDQACRTGHQPG